MWLLNEVDFEAFFNASLHLYMSVCLCVPPSVVPSFCNAFFYFVAQSIFSASKHIYMRVCPFVPPSLPPSLGLKRFLQFSQDTSPFIDVLHRHIQGQKRRLKKSHLRLRLVLANLNFQNQILPSLARVLPRNYRNFQRQKVLSCFFSFCPR